MLQNKQKYLFERIIDELNVSYLNKNLRSIKPVQLSILQMGTVKCKEDFCLR